MWKQMENNRGWERTLGKLSLHVRRPTGATNPELYCHVFGIELVTKFEDTPEGEIAAMRYCDIQAKRFLKDALEVLNAKDKDGQAT